MTSSQIIDKVAEQTGFPRELVSKVILDFGKDASYMMGHFMSTGVNLGPLGYLRSKTKTIYNNLSADLDILELWMQKQEKYLKNHGDRARCILTGHLDDYNFKLSLIMQSELYQVKNVNNGITKAIEIDYEYLDRCVARFYHIIDTLPTTCFRPSINSIQICTMQRLCKQRIFILFPRNKDCKVHPMRMYTKTKNELFGVPLSKIIMDRKNARKC